MYLLNRLAKDFKSKQKKRNSNKNLAFLLASGVAIGGAAAVLFTRKNCCEEVRNDNIMNSKDVDEYADEEVSIKRDEIKQTEGVNEDISIKRDEIKQTLKNVGGRPVGAVGLAMEHALEDLEEESNIEGNSLF